MKAKVISLGPNAVFEDKQKIQTKTLGITGRSSELKPNSKWGREIDGASGAARNNWDYRSSQCHPWQEDMKKRGAPLIPSDYCRSTQQKWRNVTERRQTLSRIQDPMSYLPGEIDKHSVKVETTWQANKTTKRRAKFLHTMRHHSIDLQKTEVSQLACDSRQQNARI